MAKFFGQNPLCIRCIELVETVAADKKRRATVRANGCERGNGQRLVEPVGLDDGKLQRSIAHCGPKVLHTGKPGGIGLRFATAKQRKQHVIAGGFDELAHG